MALPLMRLLFCAGILAVFAFGLFDFLKNFESNGCQMTYMFQQPQYLPVELGADVASKFPRYKLFLYAEGKYATESKGMQLRGIPVLFIPGNAGSYKQARSLGSVALRKAQDAQSPFHFNYFTLDLNEELSGLFGGVLKVQTEFAAACVKHILTLYKGAPNPPKSVVIVGHSMGGLIARALYTVPKFNVKHVHTIITQASPHQAPVIAMDTYLQTFYDDVNGYWRLRHNTTLKEVTVVSTGGGYRDVLVRSHLTKLDGIVDEENAVSSNTMSVPRAFTSTDHLCHVWCKQIVMATKRALFNAVDKNTKQIAAGPGYRHDVFDHHLVDNPGTKIYKGVHDDVIQLDANIKWEIRKKNSWATVKDSLSATRYSVVTVPKSDLEDYAYVALSNINNTAWLGLCAPQVVGKGKKQKKEDKCRTAKNFAHTASMLPPFYAERKVVHIGAEDLAEHIIAVLPKTDQSLEITAELYKISARHIEFNVTDLLTFITGMPNSVTSLEVVLSATEVGAVFYNITLRELSAPLQAYTAYLTCLQCKNAPEGAKTVAKLHVPWASEDTYTVIPADENGTVSLKVQSGRPEQADDSHPQLLLYLHPACTYRLAIAISWQELFGQFVRYYGTFLPCFLVINLLMTLTYQLKGLDEYGVIPDIVTAHAEYSQPWRVVLLALVVRFMLYFPEEMPLANRLYLPPDDSTALRAQNVWYPALPILLYVVANAFISFYAVYLTAAMAVLGRFFGLVFGKCCLNVRCVTAMAALEYGVYVACLPLAYYLCGTLSLMLVYFVFIVKALWSYTVAKYAGLTGASVWNMHNVYMTLLVLMLIMVTLNAPPLIVWAQNLRHDVLTLESDPSRPLGVTMAIVAMLLSYGSFPRISNEIYGAAASIVYACSVFMVLYCMTSVYRISYYVTSVLLLIGVCASGLKLSVRMAPAKAEPSVAETADDTKVKGQGEANGGSRSHSEDDMPPASDDKAEVGDNGRLRKRRAKKN